MCGNLICVAAMVLGIDVGWREMPDGDGTQYLIQIEPHQLETLKAGELLESYVPPDIGEVRGFRITVGREILERNVPASVAKAGPAEEPLDPWPSSSLSPPLLTPPMLARQAESEPETPAEQPPMPQQSVPESSMAGNPWPPARQPWTQRPTIPEPISPDPAGKPLPANQALYVEPGEVPAVTEPQTPSPKTPEPKIASDDDSKAEGSSRRWILTVLALLVSVGANLYLLWIVKGFRSRYRSLLARATPA